MHTDKPCVIGELMNNSYARARKAWQERNLDGYRELARLQTELGASFLTLNLDGTQKLAVTLEEMLEFLPKVIPAIQGASPLPISFDNPHVAFHIEAMKHFDSAKSSGQPILNSLSVTRHDIDGMIAVAAAHNMKVIVMASECLRPGDSHGAADSLAREAFCRLHGRWHGGFSGRRGLRSVGRRSHGREQLVECDGRFGPQAGVAV